MGCGGSTLAETDRSPAKRPFSRDERRDVSSRDVHISSHIPEKPLYTPEPVQHQNKKQDAPVAKPKDKTINHQKVNEKKEEKSDKEGVLGTGATVAEILAGSPHHNCVNRAKIVRIFTSSTFTDTKHERNSLMEKVYPKLKSYCHDHGYEFQVVDMRWGVREEAQNDHKITELCLKELSACQRLSTGPNFVTFLSHKYGYRPLPRLLDAEEFELITQDVTDSERELLDRWYLRDDNAVPAVYVLQPISSVLPDFASSEGSKRMKAKEAWWEVTDTLKVTLATGAQKHLRDANRVHSYSMSVTETEITEGILKAANADQHCLWFKRNITDIDKQPPGSHVARYAECMGKSADLKMIKDCMIKLRDQDLPKKLSQKNIVEYKIQWAGKGVDPAVPQHSQYLTQLCADFEHHVKAMIDSAIQQQEQEESQDTVYTEVLHHATFCRAKCDQFQGRIDALTPIKKFVAGKTMAPFVVHGDSGSGKTSLMAKAARESYESWTNGKAVVVYRFIGTTQASSSIRPLLSSLIRQIGVIYGQSRSEDIPLEELDMRELTDVFGQAVKKLPYADRPLVLILDSLDQLDDTDGGRQLEWLPRDVTPSLRLLLSTLPQEKYGCLQRCKALYPDKSCYLQVPSLNTTDVEGILEKWLKSSSRQLTLPQRRGLMMAFQCCPLPLYLKLSFDEALCWHSYDRVDQTVLYSTITATINALFYRLEKEHGTIMMTFAMSYLTSAANGLSESEMEDLLSLCDDVLNDVYQFWTPPVRRLPPLLWVRIKNQLEEYLVNRGTDGVQVIYWYHRQFIETARDRYLSNEGFQRRCHRELADYFQGVWADKPKPYEIKGETKQALRYVSHQPLMFEGGYYNLRKLNQLPFHLVRSKQLQILKDEVVCNYEFLLSKLLGVGVRPVLHDLKLSRMAFPKDKDLAIVLEALQLSEDALSAHPLELAGQLIGRIHSYSGSSLPIIEEAKEVVESGDVDPDTAETITTIVNMLEGLVEHAEDTNANLKNLLDQAKNSRRPVLLPNIGFLVPPGGQLMNQIAGHMEKVYDMDLTSDGRIAATASADRTVKLWNIKTGEQMHNIQLGQNWEVPQFVHFYAQDKHLLVSCTMRQLFIIDVQLGTIVKQVEISKGEDYRARPATVCQTQEGDVIVTLRPQFVDLLDTEGNHLVAVRDGIKNSNLSFTANEKKILLTYKHHVIYSCYPSETFFVLSVKTVKNIKVEKVRVFQNELTNWYEKDTTDHISTMELVPQANMLLVVNGLNQDILVYDFAKLRLLHTIPGSCELTKILKLYYSREEMCLYCCTDDDIGVLNPKATNPHWSIGLHHPCDVLNLKSVDGRLVVTMAEDNILRIWDKLSDPFKPDLSVFTGQVAVSSNATLQRYQGMLDNVFADFVKQNKVDTKNVLTTKNLKNYWTKDAQAAAEGPVKTRFIALPNIRYRCVVQDVVDSKRGRLWTSCISVWDLRFMKCVRRLFLPNYVAHVFSCVNGNNQILIMHNTTSTHTGSDLMWLDLKSFEAELVGRGAEFGLNPLAVYLPKKQVVLVTCDEHSRLDMVDASSGTSTKHLTLPDSCIEWVRNRSKEDKLAAPTFQSLQTAGSNIAFAQWAKTTFCVWNLEVNNTQDIAPCHTVKLNEVFPDLVYKFGVVTVSDLMQDQYVVVTADNPRASRQKNASKESHIISIKHDAVAKVKQATGPADLSSTAARVLVLRQFKERLVQLIAVQQNGKGLLLDEASLGPSANRLLSHPTATGQYCVTWCAGHKEKTVRYWRVVDDKIVKLGTFTADEEVHDVSLTDAGQSVIINCSSGLIRLCVQGEKAKRPQSMKLTTLYDDTDLDVECTLGGLESENSLMKTDEE